MLSGTTYPTYPQPVLANATDGLNYYLQASVAGQLQIGGATDDAPTTRRTLILVSDDRTASYEVTVSGSPAAVGTRAQPAAAGIREWLSVWSLDGREWQVTVTAAGILAVAGLGSAWAGAVVDGTGTQVRATDGTWWLLTVGAGGVPLTLASVAAPGSAVTHTLLDTDGSQAYTLTVRIDATGDAILEVTDGQPVGAADCVQLFLTGSDGATYALTVHADVLTVSDTTTQASPGSVAASRDEWPLLISQHGNFLYVADDRFPPPLPMIPRRWGQRRRIPRKP